MLTLSYFYVKLVELCHYMALISTFANENFVMSDMRIISQNSERSELNTALSKWKKPDPKVYLLYNSVYMAQGQGKSTGTK